MVCDHWDQSVHDFVQENALMNMVAQTNDGQTDQSHIRYAARRALNTVPRYDDKSQYRAFNIAYRNWCTISKIDKVKKDHGSPDIAFQKMTLMTGMSGVALELCQRRGPDSNKLGTYTTMDDFFKGCQADILPGS